MPVLRLLILRTRYLAETTFGLPFYPQTTACWPSLAFFSSSSFTASCKACTASREVFSEASAVMAKLLHLYVNSIVINVDSVGVNVENQRNFPLGIIHTMRHIANVGIFKQICHATRITAFNRIGGNVVPSLRDSIFHPLD